MSADSAGEALAGEARRQTSALMRSLKFRQIYGFYPGHDYQLPFRKSGEVPHLSPNLFPPNFSQFVVVDITIDSQGAVADAQIVAGMVDPPIQQILLSAVRQFKYIPAKRDNVPVPSQLEIVIPVPG
jgi:TonB family protein